MIADEPISLRHENPPGLQQFAPGNEFALKKNNSIRLKPFNDACPECVDFYYIPKGKSDWLINSENYIFYPANLAIILHGQELYAEKDHLETGFLYRLHLHLSIPKAGSKNAPGNRSNIVPPKVISTRKLLRDNVSMLSKLPDAGSIFYVGIQ